MSSRSETRSGLKEVAVTRVVPASYKKRPRKSCCNAQCECRAVSCRVTPDADIGVSTRHCTSMAIGWRFKVDARPGTFPGTSDVRLLRMWSKWNFGIRGTGKTSLRRRTLGSRPQEDRTVQEQPGSLNPCHAHSSMGASHPLLPKSPRPRPRPLVPSPSSSRLGSHQG